MDHEKRLAEYVMKKVLIITYYWPPSGGAGVQRWVKLVKYMTQENIMPYVLTVNEESASYMQLDSSLIDEVPQEAQVYKTKSFEPINYYAKFVGKSNVPTAGFSNVNNEKFSQKIINSIRSNLFVPDPRRGWNKYAYEKAVELIRKENISTVVTTSPPHSTQLIGLKLQEKLGIRWVADLRDPWTDIYYYGILGHSLLSKSLDRYYEKKVLVHANLVLTVSKQLKKLLIQKSDKIIPEKIRLLPNGFDHEDFLDVKKSKSELFTICYTGTMSKEYKPDSFFNLLQELNDKKSNILLRFVGIVSDDIKNLVIQKGIRHEFIPYVEHSDVLKYQVDANLLLLVIPDVNHSKGILTGKLFEYLATGNCIFCIGPADGDAAEIINRCASGKTFERDDKQGMSQYLADQIKAYEQDKLFEFNKTEVAKFSRKEQAGQLSRMLNEL